MIHASRRAAFSPVVADGKSNAPRAERLRDRRDLLRPDYIPPRWSTLVLALVAALVLLRFLLARGAFDFDCYWAASWAVRDGKALQMYAALDTPNAQGLYDLANMTPAWQSLSNAHLKGTHLLWGFIYPPTCAALFLPFTFLPHSAAILLWRLVNLTAYIAGVVMLVRLSRLRIDALVTQILVFLALISSPVLLALSLGQITPLVTATIVAGLYFAQTNRPIYAGLFLAMGTLLKISPVLFVFWLLWRRHYTAVGAYCVGIVALGLASMWVTGAASFGYFLHHCLPLLGQGVVSDTNLSFVGIMGRMLHLGDPRTAAVLGSDPRLTLAKNVFYALILGGTAFAFWRGRRGDANRNALLEYAALSMTALLISPITWGHHLMLAVLPLLLVTACGMQERRVGSVSAVGLAYLLLLQNADLGTAFLPTSAGAVLSLLGMLLLWFIACSSLMSPRHAPSLPAESSA